MPVGKSVQSKQYQDGSSEDCNDISFHYVLIWALTFICMEVVIRVMDWGHVCACLTVAAGINATVAAFKAL